MMVSFLLIALMVAFGVTGCLAVLHVKRTKKYRRLKEDYDNLRRTLQNEFQCEYIEKRRQLERDYQCKLQTESEKRLKDFKAVFSVENTHLLAQAVAGKQFNTLLETTKDIIEKRYNRMSQTFIGGIADEAEGLSNDVQFALCEKIWDSFQQMKEQQEDSPYVIPRNCRMAYTKGDRTVVVIEQEPQTRTLEFAPELLSSREIQNACGNGSHGYYRFNLAFPYVYFYIVFDRGKFNYLEVYFRNKPMNSMRETMYFAPLPNIFHNKGPDYMPMCLGQDFWDWFGDVKNKSIAAQADYVVSHFWQAAFNNHLGKFGMDRNDLDERVRNYARWQEETMKNPLFVLTVDWRSHQSVKGVIEHILDRREKHALNNMETQIKGILDLGVKRIVSRIQSEVKTAKETYAINRDELTDQVREGLETLLVSHADDIFKNCTKQI